MATNPNAGVGADPGQRCQYERVNPLVIQGCAFETPRLRIGPWAELAGELGLDLVSIFAETLTDTTTAALPEHWRGDYSPLRAGAWIDERDRESPPCLVVDRESGQPLGLLILSEVPLDTETVDIRIGYVLAERMWGRGYATELVAGLVEWARAQPPVATLTGGVTTSNPASASVLTSNGFESIGIDHDREIFRRIAQPTSSTPAAGPDRSPSSLR